MSIVFVNKLMVYLDERIVYIYYEIIRIVVWFIDCVICNMIVVNDLYISLILKWGGKNKN